MFDFKTTFDTNWIKINSSFYDRLRTNRVPIQYEKITLTAASNQQKLKIYLSPFLKFHKMVKNSLLVYKIG